MSKLRTWIRIIKKKQLSERGWWFRQKVYITYNLKIQRNDIKQLKQKLTTETT